MAEAPDRKSILRGLRSGRFTVEEAMRLVGGAPPAAGTLPAGPDVPAGPDRADLTRRLEVWLSAVVAAEAQVEVPADSPGEPLERYGFDSVMALNVVRVLERHFGALPTTLLFEHQTVAALARHLADTRPAQATALLDGSDTGGPEPAEPEPGDVAQVPPPAGSPGVTAGPAAVASGWPAAEFGFRDDDIAIVGLSGRFPMAADLDQFWTNLAGGRDCVTEIPPDRWDARQHFDPEPGKAGRTYSRWGGFIDDMDRFDASFFRVSPREAERMDPQERLFLQEVWHAMEDGAFSRAALAGRRVGVYVGVMYSHYQLLQAEEMARGNPLYLGSSYASIANRVSYLFDFRGPSMAVDTMCSSSLTAIHLASAALRRGDIDVALAGGVNLSVHPTKYIDLSQGRYASRDGRCRSFGAGGDGYVPGEGAAVALLRPLRAARENGDRIHAVIRGSAVGHGGKTNGYSVPNPAEQRRVIAEAIAAAGVEPTDVSYVEAHGTGTSLGDPIEIAALAEALGAGSTARAVAVGSVKSNIGHLEGAAGIAGLVKVVLQMRHRTLAPSLHAETLNPHIDFGGTSLRVQRDLADWRPPANGGALLAGLSSFGAGGASAHVVIAEPPPAPEPVPGPADDGPHLLVLSAATDERLRAQASRFADHLAAGPSPGEAERTWFGDVAYTSRVGRTPLTERLALVVGERAGAVRALREFADGAGPGVPHRGSAERSRSPRPRPEDIEAALARVDLDRLAGFWVGGADVPWERLPAGARRRVSLPGYPFERQRHWPRRSTDPVTSESVMGSATVDHAAVALRTIVDVDGPLVRDHRVGERNLAPGAFLVDLMLRAGESGAVGRVLRDVVFAAPVEPTATDPVELTVEAATDGVNATAEATTGAVGAMTEGGTRLTVVARQAGTTGAVATGRATTAAPALPPPLDVRAVAGRCATTVPGGACYDRLAALGIAYGPSLRLIDRLHVASDEAIARLDIEPVQGSELALPAVLDAAVQTVVAFAEESTGDIDDPSARVPYAVDRLEVHAAPDAARWVHTVARRGGAVTGQPQVFDLRVLDDGGNCLILVHGLVVRPVPRRAARPLVLRRDWVPTVALPEPAAGDRADLLLVDMGGDPEGRLAELLRHRIAGEVVAVRCGDRSAADAYRVIEADDPDAWMDVLPTSHDGDAVTALVVHGGGDPTGGQVTGDLLDQAFFGPLALVQAILRRSSSARHRMVSVYPTTPSAAAPAHVAVAALHRVVTAEHPGFTGTAVALEGGVDGRTEWDHLAVGLLVAELAAAESGEIRYVAGARQRRVFRELPPVEPDDDQRAPRFRHRGVYLISGGLGGLGRLVARHLAERWAARLVLVGRSGLAADGRRWLSALTDAGHDVVYLATDVGTEEGARAATRRAREAYGRLDGVLHLAGVLRDGLAIGKRRDAAERVFGPKVWGAYHLDRASAEDELDLFVVFSSASSVLGIAGQVDYAYANDLLNGFAAWRERRRAAGARAGRTVAVAWPLWDGGGMDVDPPAKERIWRDLGWRPLPVPVGLRLLAAATGDGPTERVVFYGDRDRILRSLDATVPAAEVAPAPAAAPPAVLAGGSFQGLLRRLRELVAAELRLPVDRLDARRRFEQYGLESVMVMNLNSTLESIFGALPKTLFFEFQTVEDLARHLAEAYPAATAAAFPVAPATERPPVDAPRSSVSVAEVAPARPAREPAARPGGSPDPDEPIAIVGLAGRYPMADDVNELWQVLRDGRDCITEVPAGRWDHSVFFDPTPDRTGRTYSRWGGFLRDVDTFDPLFFNISPREARQMDPQERLFLQTAWHTLEDAGYPRAALDDRRVGVFAGVMYAQYQLYGAAPELQGQGFLPASLSASVANRVSYTLGLRGPSLSIDTMCSSSLTALHYACASIRLGDCDEALAGGVNAILHPNRYLQLSQGRFASTDGRCRSFGSGGDGYVPGEGVGAVLLKPLHRAEADGDHIYGLVRATGINHGGRRNGYTVPSPVAHADLISATLRRAGVHPGDVDYIEAHGTGTALGDPIEIEGLVRAVGGRDGRSRRSRPIGSVKSNIGHLESAAGIAGLTKVLLQLRHRQLVPSLHAETLNPGLRLDAGPFHVQRTLDDWPAPVSGGAPRPRLATVSSFGAGGANASAVIEEYVAEPPATPAEPSGPELIMVSARTGKQLRELAGALAGRLAPGHERSPGADPTEGWLPELRDQLADILGVTAADIEPDADLEVYGLDRVGRADLVERIEARHNQSRTGWLPVSGSLRDLADHLARIAASPPADPAGSPAVPAAADGGGLRLCDVAFTLEQGREPMAERLAFAATDLLAAADALRRFAAGDSPPGLYRGLAADEPEPLAGIFSGQAGESFVAGLRRHRELDKLAQVWAAGVALPAAPGTGRRVSLPGYPFARDRYWIPEASATAGSASAPAAVPAAPVTPAPASAFAAAPVAKPAAVAAEPELPATAEIVAGTRRDPSGATEVVSSARVRNEIVRVLSEVLEAPVEEFRPDVPHGDFGVDSVLAVEIVDRINAALGVDLKPADFFNYATIRTLADHVGTLLPASAPVGPAPAPQSAPVTVTVTDRAPAPAPADIPVAPTDVAVIGMSARFPGAANLDELWKLLAAGRDQVREIPAHRWDVARHFDPDRHAVGKTYSRWGSVLEGVDEFDADFFGISPREARLMDPQQRLFLMEAWKALESAGYADRDLDGTECHCVVGTAAGDYHHLLRRSGAPVEGYTFTGTHPAILASRTSYLLNLRGPSLAIDTSCSSSLMAVHLACEAIRDGRAELVVAGGVAALFTPELHVLASKAGMLSPTGRCRSFDDNADGFVPGEGVGVVVLKRLAQALRDGDPIRGVIVGTGANQDGRTNGITAPSAPSQTELETAVYERFGVDPDTIGYVECHGTGTRLGDPIEIEALTAAFRRHTDRTGYCAVGSIKSNLGHTLTAAGIAGLLKALLCVERGQLVPSLHLERANRYIDFPATPFYVNTELRDWRPEGGHTRAAAVSSFGFSGTNVHAVVRQAPAPAPHGLESTDQPRLVPVSAKTAAALTERIAELEDWLSDSGDRYRWQDVAYTLAVGRSHFPVRAAFVARTPGDLLAALGQWRRTGPGPDTGPATGAMAEARRAYLAGEDVDWRALYAAEISASRRIPMPTYPFARDRYWVPTDPVTVRHRLRPDEPVVRDHVVDGQPLLPAAGHLALVHRSLRQFAGDRPVTIRRAVWLRPVFVSEDRTVEVVLTPTASGGFAFEVRSLADGTPVVHSRGEAGITAEGTDPLDIPAARTRCPEMVAAASHYARFDRIGVRYGPHFRSVRQIEVGHGEALALLTHEPDSGALPAGLLDGAIQSVAALQPETPGQRPHVPFAMERVRVLRPVPARAYAHIRQDGPGDCSVTIVDEDGTACVRIDGLAYRALKAPVPMRYFTPRWREASQPATVDRVVADPAVAPRSVAIVAADRDHGLAELIASRHADATVRRLTTTVTAGVPHDTERIYFLGGLNTAENGELPSVAQLDHAENHGVRALSRMVREVLAAGSGDRPLDVFVVTGNAHRLPDDQRHRPLAAGLFGFVRSLAKEQPTWRVRCVDVDLAELAATPDRVADQILAEPPSPRGDEIVVRGGRRWAQILEPVPAAEPSPPPLRRGGTYLIVGGAGGIGAALGEHLARTVAANVVLVGRRPAGPPIEARLAEIRAVGGDAIYVSADITDESAIGSAVRQATERFGSIHGAFHSALALRDVRIEQMDPEHLDRVLAPKTRGTLALARALRQERLDFLAFFSSAQSFSGNAGQANYAAACTAMDALARALSGSGVPVRIVNWGYWGDVGVVAKAAYRRRMQAVGVHSISVAEGMLALESVLAGPHRQVMSLKAEPEVLERFGVDPAASPESLAVAPASTAGAVTGAAPAAERGVGWDPLAGRELRPGPDGEELLDAHAELGTLGAHLVLRALQTLGAFGRPEERRSATRLADELAIVPAHRQLFATLLDVLVAEGLLRRDSDELRAGPHASLDLEAEGKRLRRERLVVAAHVDLLEACLARYPEVLRGELAPTEVMFPNGSMALVERVYRGDPLSDRLNELVAAAVTAVLDGRPSARILEVGAGTGGTSGRVLAAVSGHPTPVEYTYTDVSVGFLRHGRCVFGHHGPWLSFRQLDIERHPAEQGFEAGSFDLVVAANVLHATRDLATTLRHAAWLTAPRGRIVVSETTAFSVFATLTFGMLDGWWRWSDGPRRIPGSPLADVATWRALFAEVGYGRAAVLAPATARDRAIGQQVLVAETGGGESVAGDPGGDAATTEDAVLEALGSLIAEALGRAGNDLDPDRPFTEYGVDSIVQVDLVHAINKSLGIELRTTALFDHPTLAALTDAVCAESGDRFGGAVSTTPAPTNEDPDLLLLHRLAAGELTLDETYARLETP